MAPGRKKRRRRYNDDYVSWRRIIALFAALAIILMLVVVTGTRAKHGTSHWLGWALRTGPGRGGRAISIQSEVKRLEFNDGHAELGRFSIPIYEPLAQRSLRTNFKLDGMTDCKDKEAFQQFMNQNYHFFREQVTIAVRNSSADDLLAPDHRMLRKQILARVNRALGRSFLSDIEFSGFSLHESIPQGGFLPIIPGQEDEEADEESTALESMDVEATDEEETDEQSTDAKSTDASKDR